MRGMPPVAAPGCGCCEPPGDRRRAAARAGQHAAGTGGRRPDHLADHHGCDLPRTGAPRYPDGRRGGQPHRSSALPFATEAYRRVAAAALDHAAATRALELVERERATTRRRLRGLEHHRVPRLHATLSPVEQQLAENEREDAVRSRWVAGRNDGSRR